MVTQKIDNIQILMPNGSLMKVELAFEYCALFLTYIKR